jgi:hypothetical protein
LDNLKGSIPAEEEEDKMDSPIKKQIQASRNIENLTKERDTRSKITPITPDLVGTSTLKIEPVRVQETQEENKNMS